MENSLVNALSNQQFKDVNKKILGHVGDVLGNSADIIASAASTLFTGQPMLINFYSLLIRPFIDGYATFRDYVELEKVATFFDRVNELPFETRQAFSRKLIEDNDLDFTKNLIYSISLLRNLNEAKIAANLFIALAEGDIRKDEFQSIFNIVKSIDYSDLVFFKDRLDVELEGRINFTDKRDALEKIDLLLHNFQLMQDFKAKRSIFISNGLITEEIQIQKLPKILGGYKEPEEVAKLRDQITLVNVLYYISNRGSLLYIFGLHNKLKYKN